MILVILFVASILGLLFSLIHRSIMIRFNTYRKNILSGKEYEEIQRCKSIPIPKTIKEEEPTPRAVHKKTITTWDEL